MTEWPEKLKEDMTETMKRVKEARESLKTGVVEKKAKQAGKSVEDFSKETFTKLETRLGKISGNLASGTYRFGGKAKTESAKVSEEIKKLHQTVKERRAALTGNKVEQKTLAALEAVEKSLNGMITNMKG